MAFDNTKYDIELNSVPYRISGYQRSEVQSFIPRLSSGDQQESDFDLLRTKTLKGFGGGMLQRYWTDDTSIFASEGLYPVYDDGSLYPVDALAAAGFGGKSFITATAKTKDYLFVAIVTYNAPTVFIKRIDSAGTVTNMTIPANLSSIGTTGVTSMVVWQNTLWIATGVGGRMYQMALTGTTATEIAGGTGGSYQLMVVWQNQLYGVNSTSLLTRYTGDTSTRNFVVLGQAGTQTTSYYSRLLIFNNRIIITRHDGLYAYDGIRLVTIEDASSNVNDDNYRHAETLFGYMYYFMPDGMYRYSGATIEKLYDISEVGMPRNTAPGKNRIWLIYNNGSTPGSSRYDKSMGYDYSSGNNVDGRLVVFNGKALYTYGRTSTWIKNPATEDFAGQGINDVVAWFNDKIYIFTLADKNGAEVYSCSTAERSLTGSKAWRLVTSIYDAGFPMIDKNLDNIEVSFDGNVSADDTINIEYRIGGFDGSTGWTTLGTFKSQTKLKEFIYASLPSGIVYKKIQFRFSGTTAVGYGLSKIMFRGMLSPDVKWQWAFTTLNYGDSAIEPLVLRDKTKSTQSVHTLRGNIYASRVSDIPILYVDIDQLDQNGTVNSSVTTITLNDTSLLKDSGFVKIEDEVISYTGKTSTTIIGCVRGLLGTSAASHTNAKVFPAYRVVVRQLQNERVQITDMDNDLLSNKSRPSEISLVLQEV